MKILGCILLFFSINLTSPLADRAILLFPPLPSSFYGSVTVNGADVPEGTSVQALVNGQVFAETLVQVYQGGSVYVLTVPGDDPTTSEVEGARDGELIQFQVEGYMKGKDFAQEVERIYSMGRLVPDVWMKRAVGESISIDPALEGAKEAVLKLK